MIIEYEDGLKLGKELTKVYVQLDVLSAVSKDRADDATAKVLRDAAETVGDAIDFINDYVADCEDDD